MASEEAIPPDDALVPETETESTHRGSASTITGRRSSTMSDLAPARSNSLHPSRSRSSTASGFLNFIYNGSKTGLVPEKQEKNRFVSLFRLLILELNLPKPGHSKQKDLRHEEEQKQAYEQLTNMVKVPLYLERFIIFGLLVCLNSFLTLFTLVPLKIIIICYTAFADFVTNLSQTGKSDFSIFTRKLHFIKRDLINVFVIISTVALLSSPRVEVSRLYHDVRGQAHLKLYVIFGVLEVLDKLLSSIGQEIFTVLVGIPVTNTSFRNMSKLTLFIVISLIYSVSHSYVLIYQSVSLHVAANSYSNALMALLLSNQFAELKGAVFKKFDREGLFQVAMSDLTERFQLSLMLFIISVRNLAQLNMTQLGLVVPDSWKSWNKWFGAIFGPSMVVLGSEVFVDWLKHCFIIKFNRIKPRVYKNFLYVSSTDFMEVFTLNSNTSTSNEMSDYIILAKRIGLPILSLSICFLRMTLRDLKQLYVPSFNLSSILACGLLAALTFITLLVIRLVLGLWILKWARRIKHNHEAYQNELAAAALTSSLISEESAVSSVQDNFSREFTPETDPLSMKPSPFDKFRPSVDPIDTSYTSSYKLSEWSPNSQSNVPSTTSSDSQSEIEQSFIPGVPNTESSSINPRTRGFLYDHGESVPPTGEEKRNDLVRNRAKFDSKFSSHSGEDALKSVHRYEMSSKRIW
ncbi:hypothetical protein FT663_00946 [Candidozyma haemuli var. vulneris]|uniref:Uncharacterized protein n=1 Tax=Candidozyma haemuli TaxID=45357 RepID=A0A2V1AQC4_9ASCO|nr:hypothetical protein CXQ85_001858 [[Candida] haemuloni]KAF3993122.1 hypothetical protein FT662_00750 [[Candida] haemuloni var. vulneris]KAF3994972.1 hypothetical protein FT663_00946 [[Candida] haemuloni var. vulneris]PVH20079.1 hypothetical protein CXQ85_001858 [[Candida] haemuloni]